MWFIGMMRYLCCRLHNDWQVVEDERFLNVSFCLFVAVFSFCDEVSVTANLSFGGWRYDGLETRRDLNTLKLKFAVPNV